MEATRDALAERLRSIRETASLLYSRMMNNIEYGLQRLKNIVEKEAEGEAKEQQQGDYEQYNMVPKIKLVYEGKRVKQFTVT